MTESQIIAIELAHRSLSSGQQEFMAFVPGGLDEHVTVDGRRFHVVARDYIVEVTAVSAANGPSVPAQAATALVRGSLSVR